MQARPTRIALSLIAAAAATFAVRSSAETDRERGPWQVTGGAGAAVRPDFPGSDSQEVLAMPAVNIVYNERWFLNGDGLGAFLVKDGRFLLSASLAPELTRRKESDAAYLRGTGDVERTAVAVLRGSYQVGKITASAAVARDVADEGHGTVVDLVLQSRADVAPRLTLNYGIGARWIDDEYSETFFGVSSLQSAASGLPSYEARSGLGDTRVFVNAVYALSPRWILSVGAIAARLEGDAEDSPIVEDPEYLRFDTAVMYRF